MNIIISRPILKSHINVKLTNDLNSNIIIRRNNVNDTKSKIIIKQNKINNIDCNINIIKCNNLNSTITVSKLTVKSKIVIKQNKYDQINCNINSISGMNRHRDIKSYITVEQVFFDDIQSNIIVGKIEKVNSNYAFIM